MPNPTYISLFAGGGGFDVGLAAAGLHCVSAQDIDEYALAQHSSNTGTRVAVRDLAHGRFGDTPSAEVLVAGPPCQGFSTLGKQDSEDPRNELLSVPARFAGVHRPRFVVVENVGGTRSRQVRHHLERSEGLLRAAGYKVQVCSVDMATFGVSQRRRRTFQFAWRGASEFRFEPPSLRPRALDEVLRVDGELQNHDPVPLKLESRAGRIARRIGRGEKLCNVRASSGASVRTWDIPEVFGKTTDRERLVLETLAVSRRRRRQRDWGDADPVTARQLSHDVGFSVYPTLRALVGKGYVRRVGAAYDLVHTFNGKFRRPLGAGLAPTVDTRFGDPHYFLHPDADRGFTVREAARVQGFPDSYVMRGSKRLQYRLIGNAVPPPAAFQIGLAVRAFLANSDTRGAHGLV
jgi:DNA (cytosine-5)-methyltransferase 1